MNNKGQSLILFVLLIPIIFLILLMVYDIGSMVLLKNELNDINYMAMDYGVSHMEDENIDTILNDLIIKNKRDASVKIEIIDDKLYIDISDNINNKLSLFNKLDTFSIKSSYVGYMEENEKVIRKNK